MEDAKALEQIKTDDNTIGSNKNEKADEPSIIILILEYNPGIELFEDFNTDYILNY